jgi:phage repressor protein C with HTH and peptisase S24 domain
MIALTLRFLLDADTGKLEAGLKDAEKQAEQVEKAVADADKKAQELGSEEFQTLKASLQESFAHAKAAQEAFDLAQHFAGDLGNEDLAKVGNHAPTELGPEFVPITRISLKVSAGVTGFRVEHLEGNGPPIYFRADWITTKGYRTEKLYALRVTGDSMEPNLWDGDLIVLNSADPQPKDGEVFVANYEGEVVIKRLSRNAGVWWLTSDNTRHKPKECDEHAELIGQVIYRQTERI